MDVVKIRKWKNSLQALKDRVEGGEESKQQTLMHTSFVFMRIFS